MTLRNMNDMKHKGRVKPVTCGRWQVLWHNRLVTSLEASIRCQAGIETQFPTKVHLGRQTTAWVLGPCQSPELLDLGSLSWVSRAFDILSCRRHLGNGPANERSLCSLSLPSLFLLFSHSVVCCSAFKIHKKISTL